MQSDVWCSESRCSIKFLVNFRVWKTRASNLCGRSVQQAEGRLERSEAKPSSKVRCYGRRTSSTKTGKSLPKPRKYFAKISRKLQKLFSVVMLPGDVMLSGAHFVKHWREQECTLSVPTNKNLR